MQSATVFNIQKFSLNDGPGIRTVVFLKGCPLHCFWCSNPESQIRRPQLQWKEDACVECGACITACPQAGLSTIASKRHVNINSVDGSSERAKQMVDACPGHALSLVGNTLTTEEVLKVCLQDKPFYEDSDGGVTLSGGEPMLWPKFDIELLSLLQAEGVDTCIETEAYVSNKVFSSVANHLDHLLIDLKHGDPHAHRRGTGKTNELPLENIRWAQEAGKDVLIRTPVIPRFNDSIEDAKCMAEILSELGVERVQLLPFHNFGESKYALLERNYQLSGEKNLSSDDLLTYVQAYEHAGIHAFF